jgi:hypothetical protein
MRNIQDFYKKLDDIEENCKILIALKAEVELLQSKPRYMGNMTLSWKGSPLPERYEKYFTDIDELELLSSKIINSIKLRELKEIIYIALNSGNQIITKLNQK